MKKFRGISDIIKGKTFNKQSTKDEYTPFVLFCLGRSSPKNKVN